MNPFTVLIETNPL